MNLSLYLLFFLLSMACSNIDKDVKDEVESTFENVKEKASEVWNDIEAKIEDLNEAIEKEDV